MGLLYCVGTEFLVTSPSLLGCIWH